MRSRFRNHKHKTKEEGFFLKNGAAMLEQLIHSFNGNCNPIRIYSKKELNKATNDYHWDGMTVRGWNFQLYKGVHENHESLVKKFEGGSNSNMDLVELITNEVAIASNMSKHKNVLKLLGCCLETDLPTLVYEFPAKGNLYHHINGDVTQSLPWQTKLKIVTEVADAVAYLHYGMPKMIIHRHLKTEHIFLDQDYVAKLSEFQTSVPIPSGETHVDAEVFGTLPRCFAPELKICGRYTEKSDVYNFGIVLCEVLTGKSVADLQTFEALVYSSGWENNLKGNFPAERNMEQVTECTKLAQWCLEPDASDRPTMKEVSKRLRLIKSW